MQANFARRGDVVVVELKGRLDFETSEPFRKTCLEKLVKERVVFDLAKLSFVGSLGLKDFVETLDVMAAGSRAGVKFSGVSSEFRRMFDVTGLKDKEFFDSPEKAVQSFLSPPLA